MKPLTYCGRTVRIQNTDSEKPSSSEEGDKTAASVEKLANAEWRKHGDGYYQTTWPTSKVLEREKGQRRKGDVCGCAVSCKWKLAKQKSQDVPEVLSESSL